MAHQVSRAIRDGVTPLARHLKKTQQSIYALARGVRCTYPTAWRYVTGKITRPTAEMVDRISAWTGGAVSAGEIRRAARRAA